VREDQPCWLAVEGVAGGTGGVETGEDLGVSFGNLCCVLAGEEESPPVEAVLQPRLVPRGLLVPLACLDFDPVVAQLFKYCCLSWEVSCVDLATAHSKVPEYLSSCSLE